MFASLSTLSWRMESIFRSKLQRSTGCTCVACWIISPIPGWRSRKHSGFLKPHGSILLGVTIEDRIASVPLWERVRRKLGKEGLGGVVAALGRRLAGVGGHAGEHTWRITEQGLEHLLDACGFMIVRRHWQKPPYEYVLYLQARKVVEG